MKDLQAYEKERTEAALDSNKALNDKIEILEKAIKMNKALYKPP